MVEPDQYFFAAAKNGFGRQVASLLTALIIGALGVAQAADLRVMKTGLGEGTISGDGIACGADCNENFTGTPTVTLNVSPGTGSQFTSWGGDCAGVTVTPPARPPCTVTMDAMRSVRANFDLITPVPALTHAELTPAGLDAYLGPGGAGSMARGRDVDTPAEFVAALPQDFKENWILMPRSESLQTGTARLPRFLLVSADATKVFSFGLEEPNDSYPGAHANAIEYMQWDPAAKNFRFHEIVLAPIPALGDVIDAGPPAVRRFAARDRSVAEDDAKCFACHSTRNVRNAAAGATPGTAFPPASGFKSKPNWDTYDSWGGMLPFNRDRIYKGTVEAAAFRKLFNLWTWQNNDTVRAFVEQLKLQPDGVPALHRITRWETPPLAGGAIDGHIHFGFDPAPPTIEREPQPAGAGPTISYSFDRRSGGVGSTVNRDDTFLTLHHSCQPASDEGRGVELFDLLTAGLAPVAPDIAMTPPCPRPAVPPADSLPPNPLRVADELIAHTHATGNLPIDARPIALAIAGGCITVGGGTDIGNVQTVAGVPAGTLGFFTTRNGLSFNDVYDDTRRRGQSLPRRKADIQSKTLHRDADLYVFDPNPFDATVSIVNGLIREYGDGTLGRAGGSGGGDLSVERLRQEIFRRPPTGPGHPDETVMGRVYPDREDDSTDSPLPPMPPRPDNTAPVALYRYFLEPLGVSVDKWSMGVRGRSRTYTFADIFGSYPATFNTVLRSSLGLAPGADCGAIMPLATAQFARLTGMETAVPTYTDIQRILNKSCIDCHGGLNYPPAKTYGIGLDFSEDENPPAGERRLWKSLRSVRSLTGVPACAPGTAVCTLGTVMDVSNSYLIQRITDDGVLAHPYNPAEPYDSVDPDNPADPDVADERCPGGLMPCEGPPLSKTDIETIGRWIIGGRPNTEGDPHIRTVQGVHYDFQSAGEFVLLRDEAMELQARQTAVTTAGPLGPNRYTGLSSCVSVNTAVAMRVGTHRVSYQPEIVPASNDEFAAARKAQQPRRLILRVDGKPVTLGADEIVLPKGGRIKPTGVPEGIEIHYPGGTSVVITPDWWAGHQIWFMNINVYQARAVSGIMGVIAPGSWLPALSDGSWLGPQPPSLAQRHQDLYETFADSWRVDAASSLFDYEPGLSPQSFVVEDWPVAQPQGCLAPPQPGGPVAAPPAAPPVAQAEAERLCNAITDPDRRENCVTDVVATGEPRFAGAYLATDKLEQRPVPAPPVPVSPPNNSTQSSRNVDFKWSAAPGTESIDVTYRHCIWNGDELFDFNRCVKLGRDGGPLTDLLPPALADFLDHKVCVVLLLLLLIIATVLFVRSRYRAAVIVLIIAVILAVICLVSGRGHSGAFETRVTDLKPGKAYFWKVVAETKEGVAVESKTRRFEVAD